MKHHKRTSKKTGKAEPDLVYELGKRCVSISKGFIRAQAEPPEVSLRLEDLGIDFNMRMFKAILKGALLDKDTDKIIIWLPKTNAKKLFESYIKRHIAHLRTEIEKSETFDDLTEVAERVRSAKLALTEDAIELFAQEKSRLLGMIEDKFGGTVKIGREY